MIGDWQYSVTEGRQCVSDQEQCSSHLGIPASSRRTPSATPPALPELDRLPPPRRAHPVRPTRTPPTRLQRRTLATHRDRRTTQQPRAQPPRMPTQARRHDQDGQGHTGSTTNQRSMGLMSNGWSLITWADIAAERRTARANPNQQAHLHRSHAPRPRPADAGPHPGPVRHPQPIPPRTPARLDHRARPAQARAPIPMGRRARSKTR